MDVAVSRATQRETGSVGTLLREWRAARGVSQLELALRSGVSARHLSFIETGRSQASRQMLLALCESLDLPLHECNRLLEAGGYSWVYGKTPLDSEEMRHTRGVLQLILDRHEPFATVVVDRYATLLMKNTAADRSLAALVEPALLESTDNLLKLVFHPLGMRRFIVNWDEVARHLLAQAHRQLDHQTPGDEGKALLAELHAYPGVPGHETPVTPITPGDLVMPLHIRRGAIEFRVFSTIMTLGTPLDITLQDLRIETLWPADPDSDRFLRQLAVSVVA